MSGAKLVTAPERPPRVLQWFRVGIAVDSTSAAKHVPGITTGAGKRHQANNLYGALKSDTSSFVIVRE